MFEKETDTLLIVALLGGSVPDVLEK